jgi:hypothetical protein
VDVDKEVDLLCKAQFVTGLTLEELGGRFDARDQVERGRSVYRARLLAGVLWDASVLLVDHLFEDLRAVSTDEPGAGDGMPFVLRSLPARFAHRYTPLFIQQLIVAAADLTGTLTSVWREPACVAHELLVRALLDEAETVVDLYEIPVADGWRPMLEELLFADLDHELLYSRRYDGFEDNDYGEGVGLARMDFTNWFTVFNNRRTLPPYAYPDGAPMSSSLTADVDDRD